ncbi:hypothetical protein IAD21_03529 [Abditibacteriota bacterium]|nr:hypothetical protein IAD21_03529 [Abditibacteriota bacterium]
MIILEFLFAFISEIFLGEIIGAIFGGILKGLVVVLGAIGMGMARAHECLVKRRRPSRFPNS